jgi:glycosyltransferase involved in cell wall biosynthesis
VSEKFAVEYMGTSQPIRIAAKKISQADLPQFPKKPGEYSRLRDVSEKFYCLARMLNFASRKSLESRGIPYFATVKRVRPERRPDDLLECFSRKRKHSLFP